MLVRANRELGADFDLDAFDHRAIWNAVESRIEMHLVSRRRQTARIAGRQFQFEPGETVHTENSYKYDVERFVRLATAAGWRVERHWVSPEPAFAVFLLAG